MRTKHGKEIDFLICLEGKPQLMLEVKMSDDEPVKSFQHFASFIPEAKKLQLVKNIQWEKNLS